MKKNNRLKIFWGKIRCYCPLPALILFFLTLPAAALHIAFYASSSFSDFFNRNIASVFRMVLAKLTNALPFSFAESVLLLLPIIITVLIVCVIRIPRDDTRTMTRMTCSLMAAICFLYSSFSLSFASAYRGTTLAEKLQLDRKAVSGEELCQTARELNRQLETVLPSIQYMYASSSVMPYSLDEMNRKLNEAYEKASKTYSFIRHFRSNVKYVVLSEPMTYTHISGVYTFFTGEANLNINFPDYTLPYTAAHELSHQRGVGPEDEANFMAFLVCLQSDDPYIRYSGLLSVLEYVMSALYQADAGLYSEFLDEVDLRVRYEMSAYNTFFEKYKESTVSQVSGAINDTFLKSQGQKAGSRSYGMVVDLACAFVKAQQENGLTRE